MFPRYLGIRPDAPEFAPSEEIRTTCEEWHGGGEARTGVRAACQQYLAHVVWARQLAESYRSRATLNEWAIYFAGTIALAGATVVSGLGLAAVASTETVGLIGLSTGFTSAFTGFMDNKTRAGFYVAAANRISEALADAAQEVALAPAPDATGKAYRKATAGLAQRVARAANDLETKRYEVAAVAAEAEKVREAAQQLQDLVALSRAMVVGLKPDRGPKDTPVDVLTAGVDLMKYANQVRAFVGGEPVAVEVTGESQVRIVMPAGTTGQTVRVRLFVLSMLPGEPTFTYE